MKISRKTFILVFLVSAFIFQLVTNSLLGPEIGLFPGDGEWFPGYGSSIQWKHIVAIIIYPVKIILIEPLSFLGQDPDPVPPLLLIAFAIYWSILALVLYYIFNLVFNRQKK